MAQEKLKSIKALPEDSDNNKNNIIWDSGDVIRWIEAKDLLINKFKSVNVYNRISYAGLNEPYPEVTFDKVLPTRQIRV
jgi:hypothetical protein